MKDYVRGPSVKTLAEHLAEEQAEHRAKYRYLAQRGGYDFDPVIEAMKIKVLIEAGTPRAALQHYDTVLHNHGIESITSRAGATTYYSNTGETYNATLLYSPGKSVRIGNWGDIVERGGFDGASASPRGTASLGAAFGAFAFGGISRGRNAGFIDERTYSAPYGGGDEVMVGVNTRTGEVVDLYVYNDSPLLEDSRLRFRKGINSRFLHAVNPAAAFARIEAMGYQR